MNESDGFDISKYIKATDIAAAVSAGVVAYMTFRQSQDEPAPQQPQNQQQAAQQPAAPTQQATDAVVNNAGNTSYKLEFNGHELGMNTELSSMERYSLVNSINMEYFTGSDYNLQLALKWMEHPQKLDIVLTYVPGFKETVNRLWSKCAGDSDAFAEQLESLCDKALQSLG